VDAAAPGADRERSAPGLGLRIAGSVYGTVVVLGVIVASSAARTEPGRTAVLVVATVVVFWIAHVYSEVLVTSLAESRRARWRDVRLAAAHESSVLYAAVLPVAALLLGGLDVIRDGTALWLAIGTGVGTLAVQGVAYSRIERFGPLATATTIGVNILLGLSLALLKTLVAH
jgi:hypothetical protein